MSTNSSRLSLTARASNSFTRQNNSITNRFLVYESYCYHLETKGKLTFDLEKSKLKFSIREESSKRFKKFYQDLKEFEILKSDIKSCEVQEYIDKNGQEKYQFRINVKNIVPSNNANQDKIYFIFLKEPNKDNKKIRDHFVELINDIKYDYINLSKSDFRKMNTQNKKKIIFFMKNKDLLILYRHLSKFYEPEKILLYIKYMHPERLNISFGLNRIQLSRDEELIISYQLFKQKININILISSDINIYRQYYEALEKEDFKPEEFWTKFYNAQQDNKTYLVGDYNSIGLNTNYNKDVTDYNLLEELEKDKYYYDTYETNYVYYEEEYDKKSTINNYSINKMKEINYFSYSPQSINLYSSIKNSLKNKQPKKNSIPPIKSSQSPTEKMEIEKDVNKNENKINKPKRISKAELINRISQMKQDYDQTKNTKNKNNKTTIKAITEEVDKIYNLANVMNALNNSVDERLKGIYKNILIIRDLSLIYKREFYDYEKTKEKLTPDKKREKSSQIQHIKNEMNNIISQIKKNEGQYEQKPLINFLIKYAEYNILN